MHRAAMAATIALLAAAAPPAYAQYFGGPSTSAQGEVDLSGGWLQKFDQDERERKVGADIGDYLGLPVNDAARMRADTWDPDKWTVPEHQCEPHPADYAPHGPANFQISKIVDPHSFKTVAIQVIIGWMVPVRTIWLDGRPHPSPNAAHTWQGFSTGRWEGDTLIVTTTHLKEGWIRRNGMPRSDRAKLTEYWMRHDDILTLVSIVDDPVYLTEPLIRSWNWTLDAGVHMTPYTCESKVEVDRPQGFVAHWLPGTNPNLKEFSEKTHLPEAVVRGGREQMYPEYQDLLKQMLSAAAPQGGSNPAAATPEGSAAPAGPAPQTAADKFAVGAVAPSDARGTAAARAAAPRSAASARKHAAAGAGANPDAAELDVVRVRDHLYMLVGPVENSAVAFGADGVMVVNTQSAVMAPKILAAIQKLTDEPIRYIVNTDAHPANTGGNVIVSRAGKFIADRVESNSASILAHEDVLNRMSGVSGKDPPTASEGWPMDVYYKDRMDMHFNGEAIQLIHEPAAHTDGDSIVFFRGSDVIVAGDIFNPESYPVIDLERGGGVQGTLDALNRMIDIAIPDFNEEGGTMIIPGHGRVTDEYDLVIYRDMLTIIRDRVRDMIKRGMTLEQVQSARPTRDYDGIYGTDSGEWTTADFVKALYTDLSSRVASPSGDKQP